MKNYNVLQGIPGFLKAIGCDGHLPVTVRISQMLRGEDYQPFKAFSQENPGMWRMATKDVQVASRMNADMRAIVDRVKVEGIKAHVDRKILAAVSTDQMAAAITFAADRLQKKGQTATGSQVLDLKDAYTKAAASIFAFLKSRTDVQEFIEEMADLAESDGEDRAETLVGNTPEIKGMNGLGGDVTHEKIFVIPFDDFAQYLDVDAATFAVMSKLIDEVPQLTMTVNPERHKDSEGEDIDYAQLDPEKLMRMTNAGWTALSMPDKSYFPVNMDSLQQQENWIVVEQKRFEVVVLDASGSMDANQRAIRALAYMHNRLDKVIEGIAIVAIAAFASDYQVFRLPDNIWIIDTPEKAEQAKIDFYRQYITFKGGGTDIPEAVIGAVKTATAMYDKLGDIADGRPHVTIITDDDTGSSFVVPPKDTIINCLCVSDNYGMRELCNETGGQYMNLNAIRVPVIQ